MSYGSRLKREIQKYPHLMKLTEAALYEAAVHGARSVPAPPRCPLADKILEAMEQDRKNYGSIVSLRLDGAGWSAHIYDPELEGISSKGYEDPEQAWDAVQARRAEKTRAAEEAKAAGVTRT